MKLAISILLIPDDVLVNFVVALVILVAATFVGVIALVSVVVMTIH